MDLFRSGRRNLERNHDFALSVLYFLTQTPNDSMIIYPCCILVWMFLKKEKKSAHNSKCRVSTLVAEGWKHLNQWWFSPGEGRQDDYFDGLRWRGDGCSWGTSWWRERHSLIISRGAWHIHSKTGTMGPVRQTSGPSFLPLEMFRYLPLPNMDFGQLLRLTAQGKREREREILNPRE